MSAGRPARALARLALSASLIVAAHPILAQEPAKPEPAQVRLSPEQMLVLSQATLARAMPRARAGSSRCLSTTRR